MCPRVSSKDETKCARHARSAGWRSCVVPLTEQTDATKDRLAGTIRGLTIQVHQRAADPRWRWRGITRPQGPPLAGALRVPEAHHRSLAWADVPSHPKLRES